jgi:hypothetical protein
MSSDGHLPCGDTVGGRFQRVPSSKRCAAGIDNTKQWEIEGFKHNRLLRSDLMSNVVH